MNIHPALDLDQSIRPGLDILANEIVIALKKRRAAEYLVETARSVVEIATAVGFTDSTSFARAFKSWTGESPRDYRKNRKGR